MLQPAVISSSILDIIFGVSFEGCPGGRLGLVGFFRLAATSITACPG